MKTPSFALLAAGLALACLAATSLPAAAQWKWRDANGQVHVSDLPPPRDVPEKNVLSRPGPARKAAEPAATAAPAASTPAGPAAAASGALPGKGETDLDKRRKKAEAEEAAKRKAEDDKVAAQKAENCQRARAQIMTLESGIRVATTNAKGEREFLDDGARQREMQRARAVVASDCR